MDSETLLIILAWLALLVAIIFGHKRWREWESPEDSDND